MATGDIMPAHEIRPVMERPWSLEEELNQHVVERCRELVEEYCTLIREAPQAFPFSERDLLQWYAEIKYRMLGAGLCALCGAQVRHALPVMAELDDRTIMIHTCLCSHCLAVQEQVARRVVVCLYHPAPNGDHQMERLLPRDPRLVA